MYILVAIGSTSGSSNLARLYVGVLTADIIGLRVGQLSINCLWVLQRPKRTSNLEPFGFKLLYTDSEVTSELLTKNV